MASSFVKRTTALVGLTVAKEPRETLLKLYNETLKVLGNMPQSAQYRINAEQITKQRLGLVEQMCYHENSCTVLWPQLKKNSVGVHEISSPSCTPG
ncbi:NADH dehydrogenase [ubiquinone] 1 alpha subcomplex subunit 5-like isoform X2 [Acropora palmata]|uniref:NADH dehydrogenase [ubiquinone] 1 alpha subcomplex subunit 5-like isoform X2 n=1 Tax=Acropora palmata TaxID=6131 RepID=UPI003DA16BD5